MMSGASNHAKGNVSDLFGLDKAGLAAQGEPVLARYNAPFAPWFLLRNEIWLAVR